MKLTLQQKKRRFFLAQAQCWSGHGLAKSTESPRTWESSWLRRVLRSESAYYQSLDVRKMAYGILANRRQA